uniref:Conserved domain protein n=1 Tax=Strongyloides venezuelensis TaxID=75913 RepID=A0A0K0EV03_STRVS
MLINNGILAFVIDTSQFRNYRFKKDSNNFEVEGEEPYYYKRSNYGDVDDNRYIYEKRDGGLPQLETLYTTNLDWNFNRLRR